MKTLALILLLPALALAAPLDDTAILARVAAAPSLEEAGNLDALTLYTGTYISVTDGKASFRRQELTTLYTEYAIEHLGDPRLAWDARRQKLEIHAQRSYLPGGGAQDAPENACNEVTPHGLDRAVEFLDLREIVLTRVGLERGVTVFLDYTISDLEPGWLPYSYLEWPLGEWPAVERVVEVGPGLKAEVFHPKGYPGKVGAFEKGETGRRWSRGDLPARPHDLPDRQGDFVPWIAVSAENDWMKLTETALPVAEGDLAEELREFLEDRHPLTDRDRAEAAMEFVGERTVLVRHGLLPWSRAPRAAAEILDSQTATSLERQALLLACLAELGVEAHPFLPLRWRSLRDGPALAAGFGEPGLRVYPSDGTSFHVEAAGLERFRRPEMRLEPGPGDAPLRWRQVWKEKELSLLRVYWDLDSGEARAWGRMAGPHFADAGWDRPEERLTRWAEGWSEGAEAGDIAILARSEASLEFQLQLKAPAPEAEDDFAALALPLPPLDPARLLPGGPYAGKRDAPFVFDNGLRVNLSYEVKLPEGFEAWPARGGQNFFQGGGWTRGSSVEEGVARLKWTFEADDAQPVPAAEWPILRDALLQARDARNTEILLKKGD